MSKAVRRALAAAAATITCIGLAVSLTGCPVAAELENEQRFAALAGSGNVTGGSGGGGTVDCSRQLPDPATFSCDWRAALGAPGVSGYCAKGGCHNAATHAGDLDLTPDNLLIARLVDVPAHYKLTCPGSIACIPEMMTCAECMACGARKVLVSSTMVGTGHVFDKIAPFVPGTTTGTMDIMCGDAMPTYNTTGTNTYTQAHKDCLIAFFNELAETPPPPGGWAACQTATPMGGAGGGGGAGGTPMAGSGGT